ncbi:BatA domain-containing protein [bacterium]|nr:BatA domain-containing protein [Rubripirellula sp.]MDA7936741.1 BatA domain-containing protein [bacterium]MDB4644518.1 BatA domain-containing protein [Rubripirellula sp.]
MTFLNATLLFGLAAITVPVVLHLIARREPRKVVFPSIRFLTKRIESNRSRLRVRRWWLLALRILAVALLAIALARPAIHQSLSITWLTIGICSFLGLILLLLATVALSRGQAKTTTYGLGAAATLLLLLALIWGGYTYASGPAPSIDTIEPVAIAIIVDNSPTSSWKTPGDNRIMRMKDVATWMVTRLPRTSRVAIIDRSPQVASFSMDTANAISKIEQLQPVETTQSIASRLNAAARLVRESELPNRQILLLSDLAESTWNDAVNDTSMLTLLESTPPIALTVFDTGDFEGFNRSLSIPKLSDRTPPRGSPISVSTTLSFQSFNDLETDSVTADLQLYKADPALPVIRNGKVVLPKLESVDRTSVQVANGGSSELLLTIPALDTGTHHGKITLVGDDGISIDDHRYFTLQILPPSKVLLVCDDADESLIISQIMTASAGLSDVENAEFRVERIEFTDLPAVRLADFESILLLNPAKPVLEDTSIAEYVTAGGGVFVVLGPAASGSDIKSSFTPSLVRRWRVPEPGTFFQITASGNPITSVLGDNTPWSDFRVQQYWQLKTTEKDVVLMQYAGTDHAAMTSTIVPNESGTTSGRILVLTTPIPALSSETRSWNTLFGTDPWPAWLLTRQSIEYLTQRGSDESMLLVGQPKVIATDQAKQKDDSDTAIDDSRLTQKIQIFPPANQPPIPFNVTPSIERITFTDTPRSGIYWIRGLHPGAGFSTNLPEDSLSLNKMGADQLDQIFGPERYDLVTDREGIEFAENKATQRVSLHSPAILIALAIFLLEQILGNRFYHSRVPAAR